MVARRVCCALALSCFAACSFPEYRTADDRSVLPDGTDTCHDSVQNAGETGVDCGGRCALSCPSCTDKVANGNESDVDCGGICSARCNTDQRCREATDCVSLVCTNFVCQPASCKDQVRNGHETSTDCGGDCMGCDNGDACALDGDCKSLRCQGAVCIDAGCTDHIVNGNESDVDCGGSDCAPCQAAAKCKRPEDCESLVCGTDHTCLAPSCADSVKNQGESDLDCGGSHCTPCEVGGACAQPSDCSTLLCQSSTCVPKNASGQPLSRGKWQIVTSEGSTESGLTEPFDGDLATVWTSGTPQRTKMFVVLDLGEPQIFFKALVQTTMAPYDQDFPGLLEVFVSSTPDFGDPVMSNIMGNQWTWVDFPSAQVGRYVRFELTKPLTHPWSIGELNLYN
jgi:hypothetical protein